MSALSYELTDDGVTVIMRPQIGAASMAKLSLSEAKRFGWSLLADVDPDGAEDAPEEAGEVTFGKLHLDRASMVARFDGRPMHLTVSEWAIVERLARRGGRIVSRHALMEAIYGAETERDPKIIDVFICKVRGKFRALGGDRLIESEWGKGYRLVIEPGETAAVDRTRARPTNWNIRAVVLKRLADGPASFKDLCRLNPLWSPPSVRASLHYAARKGLIENVGSYKRALYQLRQGASPRLIGGAR